MLKISPRFIISAASKGQFVTSDKPIIAVSGKSNVGKSSFINMLANNGKLAKTSKDPGRTRLINYFDMGGFILADLPGYGYARVSQAEKQKWAKLMDDFFADKKNVAHVFALTDIRHDPTADDVHMTEFLNFRIIPFTVIATKADKLSKEQIRRGVLNIAAKLKCGKDDIITVSSKTRLGLEKVLECIEGIISLSAGGQS